LREWLDEDGLESDVFQRLCKFFSTYNANSELEFKKQSLIIYLLIHPKDIIWVTAQLAPQVHGCCSWRWCSKLQHLGAGCSYVYQVIFQPLAPIVTKQYKTIWNCQIMKSAENSKPRRTKNRSRFHLVFMVSPIWSLRSILLRPSLRVEEGGSGRGGWAYHSWFVGISWDFDSKRQSKL
jgi:hypothetical protein